MTCLHHEIAVAVTELNRLCAAGADHLSIKIAETRLNRAVAVDTKGMLWRTTSEPYGCAVAGQTQAIYLPSPVSSHCRCPVSCHNLQLSSLTALQSTRCPAITSALDAGIAISLAGAASNLSHYGPFSIAMV